MNPIEAEAAPSLHSAEHHKPGRGESRADLAIWAVVILTCLLIPLAVLSRGYTPPDDARRHVAKAVSGRPWSSILVMRPDHTMDDHAGWHATLRGMHLFAKTDAETLLTLSVAVCFSGFLLIGTMFVRRPEAWLLAVLAVFVLEPGLVFRLSLGRPFIAWMIATVALVGIYTAPHESVFRPRRWLRRIVTLLVLTLLAWLHGAWYLFLLPIAAFGLSGRWRDCLELTVCLALGSVIAALLTTQPLNYLLQPILHMRQALYNPAGHFKVPEFYGTRPELLVFILLAVVLLLRIKLSDSIRQHLHDPILIMILLSGLLGLKVSRFWFDWGLPAVALYLAVTIDQLLSVQKHRMLGYARLCIALCTACGIVFLSYLDYGKRWSRIEASTLLPNPTPEQFPPDFFPGKGGIIYSANMGVFYDLFYRYPNGPWRYIVGYEPGLMPEDDLKVYGNILRHHHSKATLSPWLKKMRPEDRLVVEIAGYPPLRELEWKLFNNRFWFGRLPQKENSTSSTTPLTDGLR